MPFTIFHDPASPGTKVTVNADHASAFQQLRESFGSEIRHFVKLGKDHVFTLRQLGGPGTVFHALADQIEAHGQLHVWGKD